MEIKTKLRRSHLGNRYDIYVNGIYSATAYNCREWNEWIHRLEAKYQ